MTWTESLPALPLDDVRPIFDEAIDEAKLPNSKLRLLEGRRHVTRENKRTFARLTRSKLAAAQLNRLPRRGESMHLVLNGTYSLWDFVPGSIQLAGQPIDVLTIATLGFSKANVVALGELLTAGQIKRVGGVLCSHYFAAATIDGAIYAQMAELGSRRGFPLAAMRAHAKLLLMQIGKRRLVVESSANLRSCHNVEQATLFDHAGLYRFHARWISDLLEAANT